MSERGYQTAVAMALQDRGEDLEQEEEQLDLIGAPETAAVIQIREKRGPGRRPGARNKRTVEMANYLLNRYASPLEVLMQIATMRVDELSASIGCTKLEALQEKRHAALAALPYIHQKQPVAVDLNSRSIVHLTIVEGEAAPGNSAEEDVITLTGQIVDAAEKADG